jgi:protein-S-isoprenylcysteine O-methyltransferase Ste14
MLPLPFVTPYAFVFWAVWLWAYVPEFALVRRSRRGAAQPGSRDAGSMRVIALVGGLGFWVASALAFVPLLRFPPSLQPAAFAAGLALLVGGSLLRRHCWRVLGRYFTGNVTVVADQPVIERGAYAWVRHPSYTAGVLMNVSLGLALGSWASTLLLLAAALAVYGYRIAVEERALLATLGAPYAAYMDRRKRLVPYLF